MEPSDVTIEILKGTRDEVRQTNPRLDQTTERLETGLTALREELSRRIG